MGDSFWAGAVGAGIVGFLIAVVLSIGIFALFCWLLYAIIWRAVRRGLREYNGEMRNFSAADFIGMSRRP